MSLPNLFQFATSELSQDAFLCWLISWAEPQYATTHQGLHNTACSLLNRLFELCGVSGPTGYGEIEVKQQVERIDVLVRVNNAFTLVIEDKTHTSEHSDQLTRYLSAIRSKWPSEPLAAVYFKTGDQSSYKSVENAGFRAFRRQEFLKILEAGAALGIQSDIFRDYLSRLKHLDDLVAQFVTLPITKWEPDCWTGLFIELQKRLENGEWAYVPNPSGGFMGFWWHEKSPLYLQLAQDKLCFKIDIMDKAQQSGAWEEWHASVMAEAHRSGMPLKRPRRRAGRWMTVAVLDGDYRRADEQGRLDLDRTVVELRKAEAVVDAVVQGVTQECNDRSPTSDPLCNAAEHGGK